jgi:hypothetical protein
MGRLSKTAKGSVFTQRETTSARIEGLLKDPIGALNNTHKPIIGWLCCYTLQGIILAAGLTPAYRTILEPTSDLADSRCFKNGIIRGSHQGISQGIFTKAGKLRMERPITMTWGMTKSPGIVDAVRRLLKNEIHVPKEPQIVGVLGAVLSAFRFPSDSTAYRGERRGRT